MLMDKVRRGINPQTNAGLLYHWARPAYGAGHWSRTNNMR